MLIYLIQNSKNHVGCRAAFDLHLTVAKDRWQVRISSVIQMQPMPDSLSMQFQDCSPDVVGTSKFSGMDSPVDPCLPRFLKNLCKQLRWI